MKLLPSCDLGLLVALGCVVSSPGAGQAAESDALRARFADPGREYASAPLWVWNDRLTEEQIRSTLRDLASQHVRQAFVHPRPGLMTPYLSDEWFGLWKAALDEAERLDMNVWIYDENSYPSGFAGGLVPAAMPESRVRGLVLSDQAAPRWGEDVHAVYRLTDDGYENVTAKARAGDLPGGKHLVAKWKEAPSSGWFGGYYYVDLLKPGVTEKFIEVTFDAYAKHIGEHFGRRLPGIFTDEPHLMSWGGFHWNEHLRDEFTKRWGYDMEDHFPALLRPVGDWRRIRHNYHQLLLEQFVEHWGKPCYEWCERHGLEFTGHYWEHGWPGTAHGPDNMAMYAWHQRPAIDCLMNQYSEEVHAQFGNVRAVKELSSVANQLGRERTLCEAYGAGGWELRFEDMKRIGDWLYVLGVNTLDEHVSYITIRGARKRDHPQSFSYHEPWWEDYHVMADYFTRLSLAMSSGQEVNRILVLEPTTTAWMYQTDKQKLDAIGAGFQQLVTGLAKAQVEFDLGCEDIIARHGAVMDLTGRDGSPGPTWLEVGDREYHAVVIPPHTENLNAATMDLLADLVNRGGRVVCCGPPPSLVDGVPSDRGKRAARSPSWEQAAAADLPEILREMASYVVAFRRAADDRGILLHQRRELEGGHLLFLVNTSIDQPTAGTLVCATAGVERWDPATGKITPHPFKKTDKGLEASFELPPCGSLLLFLSEQPSARGWRSKAKADVQTAKPRVRRLEPNVLVLDYVDITTGGKTEKGLYFYRANQMAWQAAGMERNPWDSAVQFRDELISKKFPPESGFEATYRFTIRGDVPRPLQLVVERPDLYTITCNGKPVTAEPGAWWLDKAFGRIDVTAVAREGENTVTIKARPMTVYHELEPAYVLGDFSLEGAERGFTIVPPKPLEATDAGWDRQGCPFYSAGVAYAETFHVEKPEGRYVVELPNWLGSVARLIVNGEPAGHFAWQPWECDVTNRIKPGENTIEVVVVGTLKNTLGPHHAGAPRGAAWPPMFQRAPQTGPPPGKNYDTIGYGLFEPFVLKN